MIMNIFEDALFAAMAAIGFSAISHTPRRCWLVCAVAAACGHSLRFWLMADSMGIILASCVAGFAVGIVAVAVAPLVKTPAEACLFPSLLPMIPGMYAYRTIEALIGCVGEYAGATSSANLYSLASNGITCVLIVFGLVIGGTVPVFLFKKISFRATR